MNFSIKKGGNKVIFKKKIKKTLTSFIVFICVVTFGIPSNLALAEVSVVPVITLLGDNTVYVAAGSIYEDPGVDIIDDKDTNLSATVTVTYVTNGPITVVTTGSAVTYEKGAYMVFDKEGTYELQYNVTDSDKNVAAKVTRIVEVNTMDDEHINSIYTVLGYETDLRFKLLSKLEIEDLLEGAITTPASVEITRKDNILTAELLKVNKSKFTTSAGVKYEWYRDNKSVQVGANNTYTISDSDLGKKLIVKVQQYNLESTPFYIDDEESQVTTPSGISVKIKGTEKVGYTLTGGLILNDGSEVTTGSAVTYGWYRLSSKDSKDSNLLGNNKTYNLVSSDQDKYIKLIIIYKGKAYESITSKISKKSSSSHSRSSSTNTLITTTNDQIPITNEQIPATNAETSTDNQIETNNNATSILQEGNKNEQVVNGWNQKDGSWYLMDANGIRLTGWQSVNDAWYLLKSDGAMATGWQQVDGTWYLLKSNGVMATGWQQIDGTWYLLKSNGAMATGWQQVDGTWYFLKSNGALAK
jgi:glucan-binding YG repeat protein